MHCFICWEGACFSLIVKLYLAPFLVWCVLILFILIVPFSRFLCKIVCHIVTVHDKVAIDLANLSQLLISNLYFLVGISV